MTTSGSTNSGSATTTKGKDTATDAACDRSVNVSGKGPCAIYFCSEQLAKTAGIGTLAIRAKIKEGIKPVQDSIFESRAVLESFKKAGINEFFKIPATKENAPLAKKYKVVQDNTLVLCSPSGELVVAVGGAECNQTNIIKVLKAWPEIYEAWQKKKVLAAK